LNKRNQIRSAHARFSSHARAAPGTPVIQVRSS
jgi:hypothetical protein